MTASSASSKAKAKFSSRNLSAVYKAPVLRGVELSANGVSSSGLNRMLVLKAPVRGGVQATTKANAVAAPTPINTPSLRKENNGQDVNVSLVPTGKNGGWGVGSDGSVEREDANARQAEMQPTAGAAPQPMPYHANAAAANAWNGGVASLSRTSSSSSGGGAAAVLPIGIGSATSGRWGDDAVEEDLIQAEMHRQMERTGEFPELPDHHNANGHVQMRFHEHNYPQQHSGYAQDARFQHSRAAYRREEQYYDHHRPVSEQPRFEFGPPHEFERARHHRYEERGDTYREAVYHQRPSQDYVEERGHRGFYQSNQDARYDNFSRGGPRAEYDRHNSGGSQHPDDHRYHAHQNYDARNSNRGPEEYYQAGQAYGGYGPRYYRENPSRPHEVSDHASRADFQEPSMRADSYGEGDNQADHSKPETRSSRPNSATAWRTPSPAQEHASAPASVWRMSESEVGSSKQIHEYQRAVGSAQQYPRPIPRPSPEAVQDTTNVSSSRQIRILKRNGPRMLFDPKSGTMVEVEETVSSRRSNTSSPAPRDAPLVKNELAVESPAEPPVVGEVEQRRTRTSIETVQDKVSAVTESPVASDQSIQKERVSPSENLNGRKARTRSKPSELRKKRVALGGKMKRVVVAYRPVPQLSQENGMVEPLQSKSTTGESVQESSSQLQQIEKPTRRKVREARAKVNEKPSSASGKSKNVVEEKNVQSKVSDEVTKDWSRVTLVARAKGPRSSQKRAGEHTKTKSTSTALVKSNATTRFDELKVFSAGAGVVFVDEDQSAQDQFEDEDATFTTVKSRRAILLERKREREQLAAALSGFHERGGTKRMETRVVLPASLQRFGQKGLLVGFRSVSNAATGSDAAAAPPQLVKPFIDVIRPPALTNDGLKEMVSESVDDESQPVMKKTKPKKDKPRTSKSRANHLPGTIFNPKKITQPTTSTQDDASSDAAKHSTVESEVVTPAVKLEAPVSVAVLIGSSPCADVVPEPVNERSESNRQRERRSSAAKKPAKKIYVAKQSSLVVESSSEVLNTPSAFAETLPATRAPSILNPSKSEVVEKMTVKTRGSVPVKETTEVRSRTKSNSKPRKSSVPSEDESTLAIDKERVAAVTATAEVEKREPNVKLPVKEGTKTKKKHLSPKAVGVATVAVAKENELLKTELQTHVPKKTELQTDVPKTDVTKTYAKKSRSPKREVAEADQSKSEQTKVAVTKVVKQEELEKVLPPSTATRRLSKAKSLGVPKTSSASSTQKIYKKVYVVKAASTAAMSSPSAA